ncbi:MAG: ABC transporter substrate-binding protein [Ideonella sp.]|nr:ABC transporter substrate-binding protein [Ideonella sp.]
MLIAALLCAPALLQAQIKVGQTAGFTGPVAAGVKEITDGAKLYLDHINAKGGIQGQRIELISMDDEFVPAKAAANAEELMANKSVVAMLLSRGTPHTEAIAPLLSKFRVPLIGPSTGARVLHSPVNPWIFNVRAPYRTEAVRAIDHLVTTGVNKIGMVYVDDSFGADLLAGAQEGFAKHQLQPALQASFSRSKPQFDAILSQVQKLNPQALLVAGSGQAVADLTQQLRATGNRSLLVTFSNNASLGFVKQLGTQGRGVIVTQVFPHERSRNFGLVREAMEIAKQLNRPEPTPAMLEGFSAAKVLVAGLNRSSREAGRENLRRALDAITRLDLGDMVLGYSAEDHTGLDYVDISIIDGSGKFLR